MYRCLVATVATLLLMVPATAQVARQFPRDALRGEIVVGTPPEIALNGKSARLAPAARIRGQSNMLEMSASLSGARLMVHYTLDVDGLVKDVWILRPEELAKTPWPVTPEQAQKWEFDPMAQTWTRR